MSGSQPGRSRSESTSDVDLAGPVPATVVDAGGPAMGNAAMANAMQQTDGGSVPPGALADLAQAGGNAEFARLIEGRSEEVEPSPALDAVKSSGETRLGVRVPLDPTLAALFAPMPSAANPRPLKKDRDAPVKAVAGTAFGTGVAVSPSDVSQGQLGDCYLLAMMIAIARVRPDVLQNLVKDNGDGTYTVTLYEDHLIGGATAYTETVTGDVPVDPGGNPLYAQVVKRSDGSRPLWPVLIEKAYAKHEGGYSDIEGGEGTTAAQALTQQGGERESVDDYSESEIAGLIGGAIAKGSAITASSIQRPIDGIRDWLEDKTGIPTTDVSEAEKKWNIAAPHEYIVKSVDASAKTIDLINPWGSNHLTALPLSVFKVAFRHWTVVQLGPAPGAPGPGAK